MPPISTKSLWEATAPQNQEPHPADDGYTPPVSTVKLPSRGLIYPPESALYMCEALDIKGVTAKEENILASPVLIKKGIVLTSLMRACITNRLIDPDQMLVGDRNAVLVSIRVSAYGPKYMASITCQSCGESHEHEFDLSRLSLKTLDETPTGGPGTNEFSFTLPISKREVRFRLMDAAMVAKLDRDIEAIRKKTGTEQGVTLRLITQVTYLEGVKEAKDLPRAIGDISARDARALRLHMDEIAPGVDMEQDAECASCGEVSKVEIPIGTEFFWPTSDQ